MKKTIKYILDGGMMAAILLLMGYELTGNLPHELVGFGMLLFCLLHVLVNRRWMTAIRKLIQTRKPFSVYRAWLLMLISADMIALLVSSLMISHLLALPVGGYALWVCVHKIAAYAGIAICGLHIGAHASQMWRQSMECRSRVLSRIALGLLMAAGIWSYAGLILGDAPAEAEAPEDDAETAQSRGKRGGHGQSGESFEITETVEPGETLEEFLSRLTCTGCGRRCLLSSPQCGTGRGNAAQAETYYNEAVSASSAAETAESLPDPDAAAVAEATDSGETDAGSAADGDTNALSPAETESPLPDPAERDLRRDAPKPDPLATPVRHGIIFAMWTAVGGELGGFLRRKQ